MWMLYMGRHKHEGKRGKGTVFDKLINANRFKAFSSKIMMEFLRLF